MEEELNKVRDEITKLHKRLAELTKKKKEIKEKMAPKAPKVKAKGKSPSNLPQLEEIFSAKVEE